MSAIEQISNMTEIRCNKCNRLRMGDIRLGDYCGMTQPDGYPCGGLFLEKTPKRLDALEFKPVERPYLRCPCGHRFEFEFDDWSKHFDHSFQCPGCNTDYTVKGAKR